MTHLFGQGFWDEVWGGAQAGAMSTSPANPHLVRQIGGLTPGTALEAGCGAGAEAIWLAQQGWQVTAVDLAAEALATAAERATASDVADRITNQIEWVQADMSTWEPATAYDLVTTHYAHPAMGQLEFYDRIAAWVAPGGTLLIVGHLGHESGHGHGHGTPAEASVSADDITACLDPSVWASVTAEESQRTMSGPDGHERTIHDVVVRARRHAS